MISHWITVGHTTQGAGNEVPDPESIATNACPHDMTFKTCLRVRLPVDASARLGVVTCVRGYKSSRSSFPKPLPPHPPSSTVIPVNHPQDNILSSGRAYSFTSSSHRVWNNQCRRLLCLFVVSSLTFCFFVPSRIDGVLNHHPSITMSHRDDNKHHALVEVSTLPPSYPLL